MKVLYSWFVKTNKYSFATWLSIYANISMELGFAYHFYMHEKKTRNSLIKMRNNSRLIVIYRLRLVCVCEIIWINISFHSNFISFHSNFNFISSEFHFDCPYAFWKQLNYFSLGKTFDCAHIYNLSAFDHIFTQYSVLYALNICLRVCITCFFGY